MRGKRSVSTCPSLALLASATHTDKARPNEWPLQRVRRAHPMSTGGPSEPYRGGLVLDKQNGAACASVCPARGLQGNLKKLVGQRARCACASTQSVVHMCTAIAPASGSGGLLTNPAGAVHKFILWAGELSTAGASCGGLCAGRAACWPRSAGSRLPEGRRRGTGGNAVPGAGRRQGPAQPA